MKRRGPVFVASCLAGLAGLAFGLAVPYGSTPLTPSVPESCIRALELADDYATGLEELVKIKIEYANMFSSGDYYGSEELGLRQDDRIAENDQLVVEYVLARDECFKENGDG